MKQQAELSEDAKQLLNSAVVGPDCPDPIPPEAANPDEVVVEVLKVAPGGCLSLDYQVTGVDEMTSTIQGLSRQESVVAVSPLLLTPQQEEVSSWHVDALGVPHAQRPDKWPTGEGVAVAVIDGGVDGDHPALEGSDLQRWNLRGSSASDRTHGTMAAGVVAAEPNSGFPTGIAPDVALIDVPLIWKDGVGDDAEEYVAGYASAALLWAANRGADVVNLSWGLDMYPDPDFWDVLLDSTPVGLPTPALTLQQTIRALHDRGIVTVVAGGNCGPSQQDACNGLNRTQYPAALDNVVAVGATNVEDVVADFSSRSPYIDVVAPGEAMTLLSPPDGSVSDSGTSFAAPVVSGLVALMLEAGAAPVEVEGILTSTAQDLGPAGRDDAYGHGLVDPQAALDEIGWQAREDARDVVHASARPEPVVEAVIEGIAAGSDVHQAVNDGFDHGRVEALVEELGSPMTATAWPMLDPPQSPSGPACSLEGDVTVVCLVHVEGSISGGFVNAYPARGPDDLWRLGAVRRESWYAPLTQSRDAASAVVRDAVQGLEPPAELTASELHDGLTDLDLFGLVEAFTGALEVESTCTTAGDIDRCDVTVQFEGTEVGRWEVAVIPSTASSPPRARRIQALPGRGLQVGAGFVGEIAVGPESPVSFDRLMREVYHGLGRTVSNTGWSSDGCRGGQRRNLSLGTFSIDLHRTAGNEPSYMTGWTVYDPQWPNANGSFIPDGLQIDSPVGIGDSAERALEALDDADVDAVHGGPLHYWWYPTTADGDRVTGLFSGPPSDAESTVVALGYPGNWLGC